MSAMLKKGAMGRAKTVVIASLNPTKVRVANLAFKKHFPGEVFEFIVCEVSSGVPSQPFEAEILLGAITRVKNARAKWPNADYYIGQEGGVTETLMGVFNTAYIVVENALGTQGIGRSASFPIPTPVRDAIHEGYELNTATDRVFGATSKRHRGEMIGVLTDGLIDRTELYRHAAIIALAQVRHHDWYK